jgi:hypothetical protein
MRFTYDAGSDKNQETQPDLPERVTTPEPVSSETGSEPITPSIIDRWLQRAQVSIYAHNAAATYYSRRDSLVSALTLGGIVLLGQLALVLDLTSKTGQVITGTVTVALALTSALSWIWDFRAKALQHRVTARQYAVIRRALEDLRAAPCDSDEATWRRQEIRRLWDAASATAPTVPDNLREEARRLLEERSDP